MPDPTEAFARRGAPFTIDGAGFLTLTQDLRQSVSGSTKTIFAPSFDHALKDPRENDIAIEPTARIIIFEGIYLSLDREPWNRAARLMDELWFVDVEFEVARRRLVPRHVRAGISSDEEEADRRVRENDLINGRDIVEYRIERVDEVVYSREDDRWKPDS
ncbi:Uridine kinase [Chlorociboria aeruginascens]|nr:Uridine kinase [Chlorociboria aeruginascens]